jgi:hypothetical protein
MKCRAKQERRFCGKCWDNKKGRGAHPGHLWFTSRSASYMEERLMAMKRPAQQQLAAGAPAVSSDEEMSLLYPGIWEYMVETAWDDGKARKTSTLTVFCEDGLVKVCLSDREQDKTTWASGTSLADCLASMEVKIATGNVEWRKAFRPGGKK